MVSKAMEVNPMEIVKKDEILGYGDDGDDDSDDDDSNDDNDDDFDDES